MTAIVTFVHRRKLPRMLVTAAAIAALPAVHSLALAQVKPGDFITPENAAKVKDLVSPGTYYKVVNGMTMKIVPTGRIEWPPPYQEATEKYSSQVRLSPDRRTPVGYVAGQPFPLIDPNDPDAAVKIIWNNVFRPIASDDMDLRYYECDAVYSGPRAGPQIIGPRFIAHAQVAHWAVYALVGRTEVDPVPVDPDFLNSDRLFSSRVGPILAPNTWHGISFLRNRYADPNRPDDLWNWTPGARRLRRLNEAAGSDSPAETTWDPDHFTGFDAKPEEYSYRFLGERRMLACAHAEHSPETSCPTDGGGSACPERWEVRNLYIVEAAPRRDRISEALHSKTVIYMDSEMWFEPYVDTYARNGQLFQNHIYWLTYRDRPVPDARVAIYPFKRLFFVAATSTDTWSGLSTPCYFPGPESPERECWYINMGSMDKQFFTTASIVRGEQTGR